MSQKGLNQAFVTDKGASGGGVGRRVLGRGLSALMGTAPVSVEKQATDSNAQPRRFMPEVIESQHLEEELPEGSLLFLSVDRITPNKNQPRQHFEQAEIETLSQSIKESGLIQPIVVRRLFSGSAQGVTYEIVAGERRFRAAKLAGLLKIPTVLRQLDDKEALELGLVENVQRSDLNPIEEALAFERLVTEFGHSHADIAKVIGKDRASIANSIRLLKLGHEVRELLIGKKLSAGHGRALLKLENEAQQVSLAEKILAEGLSVRDAERLASSPDSLTENTAPEALGRTKTKEKAPSVLELEERVRRVLGTKVSLKLSPSGKGELRVNFYSQSELERLLERLGA